MSRTAEERPAEPGEAETWVKVHHHKGRRPAKKPPSPSSLISSSVPTLRTPTLTREQVEQEHDRFAAQWRSSPSFGRLQELFSEHAGSLGSSVTKAICFGLGTLDPSDGAWGQKRVAHTQLAAFLSIVESLQKEASQPIRCIFQEPIFNSIDKAFITSLGHQVVESPVGFELVDSETLAFGVHLYRDIYSQVIATHAPAIFVGTSYDVWEDLYGIEKENWAPRMKEFDQLCVKAKFPENPGDTIFSSATIHWRQKDQS
ncbi:hypothetical protein F4802DRAFT_596604 [Xylaria palmicola]|nr:hypothetical protein F4802DRAFT_596604 [Xylaria palmicola]